MAASEAVLEYDVSMKITRGSCPERNSQARLHACSRGMPLCPHRNRMQVHSEGVDRATVRQYLQTWDKAIMEHRSEMRPYLRVGVVWLRISDSSSEGMR